MHVALARPPPCEKETKTATQRASPRFAFACGSTTGVVAVSRLDEGGRNELAHVSSPRRRWRSTALSPFAKLS